MTHRSHVYITGLLLATLAGMGAAATFESSWPTTVSRPWAGPAYWANRLQDWQVDQGRLECIDTAGHAMRTVHLLTHQLGKEPGSFRIRARMGLAGGVTNPSPAAACGFLVGVGKGQMDYRAAAIVHCWHGNGAGIFGGVTAAGTLFIRDNERPAPKPLTAATGKQIDLSELMLELSGRADADETYTLTIRLLTPDGQEHSTLQKSFPAHRLAGNVALVSHPGGKPTLARFWFADWSVDGAKVLAREHALLGPVICTQHTLSDGLLTMTAQLAPLGDQDGKMATLETLTGAVWKPVAHADVIVPGYTATFRVPAWDTTRDVPYRVVYHLRGDGNATTAHYWGGTVRRDPVRVDSIVVAGFTGNHVNSHSIGGGWGAAKTTKASDWVNGMWFPHADVVRHVTAHKPHVLFFSGDQVYEGKSPTFADRKQIKMDYLYKWYIWCWAYRDLMRDTVTVTIPDDHDVYQGNLWGDGGRKTDLDTKGGYVHPADFVRMVERTQTSHLPPPWHKEKLAQGIGAYYTKMVYGRIGFAILEDRKFKSGCYGRFPGVKLSRPDHVTDKSIDVRILDVPGLTILGDDQLSFVKHFAADWKGHDMKMALSQTIFASMATHHGGNLQRLRCDMDSDGWPQTARNQTIDALRRGFMFHLAGDQHLASLVHHGVDDHNDGIWSMCVPSVANFYPRAWMPEAVGANRQPGMPGHLGEHLDGFGNKVTVYAVTNPTALTRKSTGVKPLDLHDKMPGYGIVRMNKRTRDITVECWPRYADPSRPNAQQYAGWPRTISQFDNYPRKPVAFLPELIIHGLDNAVVRVFNQDTDELVYAIRIKGRRIQPGVFAPGVYRVEIGDSHVGMRTLPELEAARAGQAGRREISF